MKKAITFFIFFIFCVVVKGQDMLFDAQLITTEDGLANLMTTVAFKDSKGFMWFGTNHGLNRYDGHNFNLYSIQMIRKSVFG